MILSKLSNASTMPLLYQALLNAYFRGVNEEDDEIPIFYVDYL